MSNTNKFDPKDLDPNILNEALNSLSDYYISKRRLKIRETTLGVGGFGIVRLADLSPNTWFSFGRATTTVAVKELRSEIHNGVPLRTAVRLAREIKVWASCKHENILQFTGYYLSKDFKKAYLVSPYMNNGNIKDYLYWKAPSRRRRLELILDTIMGLAYLHSRDPPIVHGDLKSLNVLVANTGKALLCDLGLSKAMEDQPTGLSTSNGFKGTIRYTSPEVLSGSPRDCPSDIWAWGCLALEIITGNPPYHEIQTETQVLLLICGHEDQRRTPEPTDPSWLPVTALTLLKMCWGFELGGRPDARQCVDEVKTIHSLFTFGVLEHKFIPPTRLNASLPPKDPSDLVHGVSLTRLPLQNTDEVVTAKTFQDTDEVVMVKTIHIYNNPHLKNVAYVFNRRWALKHENLLELTGYSMDQGLGRFYVMSPYSGQTVLLQYLRRNRHLAPGARLKLLQDMLKGLAYLHSSAVNAVYGALNPWTIVINGEGKAVLPLIGGFQGLENVIVDGSPLRPTHLWLDPNRFISFWITSKSDIWSWACVVLQVICESRQFDGTSIYGPEFMESIERGRNPEPHPAPILPDRLQRLVRKCWSLDPDKRPSARDCLDVLDLVIQENLGLAGSQTGFRGRGRNLPGLVRGASRGPHDQFVR